MENLLRKRYLLIMGFVFNLLTTMNGHGQVCGLDTGDKFSLPNSTKEVGATGGSPLEKGVKVVSLLDRSSSSFDKELEVWKHFILSVDTSHVGFVFFITHVEDLNAFTDQWKNEGPDYPFFYDHQLNCIPRNDKSYPKEKNETTMLVDKDDIVLTGKSPVTNEPYN